MGLMDALHLGVSGLKTSQISLNATAHNITNAETPGYVRQQMLLTDFGYNNIGGNKISTWQIGLGSDAQALRQIRDQFLDQSYRKETGRQGFYASQFEAADEMQEVMGELEGVQFQNSIKDFWVTLQELAKEPDSIVTRSTLIQNAVNFTNHAEKIYNQIATYQIDLNTQIQQKVDRVNEIGDEIRELNNRICFYECNGQEHANDLRDKRNTLLDELGGLIDIKYREETDGKVSVQAEAIPFITEDHVFYMGTKPVSEDSDMIVPYWPSYGNAEVFNFDHTPNSVDNTDIGSLKGIVLARGRKVGKYTDIPSRPIRENFEDDASYEEALADFDIATKKYNKEVNDSVVMSVQSQFDRLIHGIVTTINDILCPNKEVMLESGETVLILEEEEYGEEFLLVEDVVGFDCQVQKTPDESEQDGRPKWEETWDTSNCVPYRVKLSFRMKPPDVRDDPLPLLRVVEIPIWEYSQKPFALDETGADKNKDGKKNDGKGGKGGSNGGNGGKGGGASGGGAGGGKGGGGMPGGGGGMRGGAPMGGGMR